MSSSGLIYAVIVGAWAAYLVPMWLRRQDELNEARPTERFSTAIRLLSGRAGMERRYAKGAAQARAADTGDPSEEGDPADGATRAPDAVTGSVDVRAFAMPPVREEPAPPRRTAPRPEQAPQQERPEPQQERPEPQQAPARRPSAPGATARARRSKVLARRRRTTMLLFLAFTLGAVAAAVGGLALLWAPALPAILLSSYIAYLRRQERRRFVYAMDRRQAEAAARHLRERGRRPQRRPAEQADEAEEPAPAPAPDPERTALAADRRALVEQTDHAEWVDQQRARRHPADGESWEPVPVPLPTYVTAPVAPRATPPVDLGAPDTWSSARSSAAPDAAGGEAPAGEAPEEPAEAAPARRAASARRSRERGRTPLFDQYDEGERPRAANE
ncbi:gephyrin-like molybdotransferase receptor GlpR [Streptomyces sp. NPDC058374]|uniref:divisome protein SepX/GlpR n=1 Tax=Streptomyces sp. NPDC058374 TaxID=3346466 RepID=UPI00364DB16C